MAQRVAMVLPCHQQNPVVGQHSEFSSSTGIDIHCSENRGGNTQRCSGGLRVRCNFGLFLCAAIPYGLCAHSAFDFFALHCTNTPLVTCQLEPGNKEAVRAARRIKDKVAQAAKLNTPIRQVQSCLPCFSCTYFFGTATCCPYIETSRTIIYFSGDGAGHGKPSDRGSGRLFPGGIDHQSSKSRGC